MILSVDDTNVFLSISCASQHCFFTSDSNSDGGTGSSAFSNSALLTNRRLENLHNQIQHNQIRAFLARKLCTLSHKHFGQKKKSPYWSNQMFWSSSIIGLVTKRCVSLNSFIRLNCSCHGTGARMMHCGKARGTAVMCSRVRSSTSFRM